MIFWTRNVYLDHNATTPVAKEVRKAMAEVLKTSWGNPASLHTHGRTARGLVEQARISVAKLIGCRPERIFFTSGGTEGNNAIIKGVFAEAGKGHIVTSKIEHESILGACKQVEALGGEVTYLDAGRDGLVRAEDVKAAIRPDTILISIMHANNETGVIQPVEEIARIAREANVPFHVDAVQSCGKIPVQVEDVGCEFLTLSAHKINGPKGAAALYWRGDIKWKPLIFGGDQEQQLRAGTEGVAQIVGFGKAAELAAGIMDAELKRLQGLRDRFLKKLRKDVPDIKVNEAQERQLPGTMNITFPGKEALRILAGLDCYEISVSMGSACTADRVEPSHVLLGMGLSDEDALSSVRFSMGRSTTQTEMNYVLAVLEEIYRGDPAGFAYVDPQHLTAERIQSKDTFLIDLRFPYERFLCASIPTAKEWSHIYFERYIKRIPWDKEVIMMCGTGIFSFSAGYRLAKAGHPKVRVVYGGYAAWQGLYPELLAELRKG